MCVQATEGERSVTLISSSYSGGPLGFTIMIGCVYAIGLRTAITDCVEKCTYILYMQFI